MNFWKLSKLPWNKVVEIQYNGNTIRNPKITLTKDNIYFSIYKIPVSSLSNWYTANNELIFSPRFKLIFRSWGLNLTHRNFTVDDWVQHLLDKNGGNPKIALARLITVPISSTTKKQIEDKLNEIETKISQQS